MCKCPIHIGNRSRTFVRGNSPIKNVVPCGHCSDCIKSFQEQWFVRAFFEYKRIEACKGRTYLILLTYDDFNMPYYHNEDYISPEGVKGFHIPCFNPTHVKRFRDRLRVFITRKYGIEKSRGVKFFFAGEYGTKKGRPHYHAIIFVPFAHKMSDFLGVPYPTVRYKKEYVRFNPFIKEHRKVPYFKPYGSGIFSRAWKYGFVGKGKKNPAFIFSPNGIKYTMKYLDKCQSWIFKYGIPEFKQWLRDNVNSSLGVGNNDYNLFRRILPRHFQSTFFGSEGFQYFYNSDGSIDYSKFLDNTVNLKKYGYISSTEYAFALPRYYYNKFFYNFDKETGVRYLNSKGLFIKSLEFDRKLQYRINFYNKFYNIANLQSILDAIPSKESINFLSRFNYNVFQLHEEMFPITLDDQVYNMRKLALYEIVYRYVDISDLKFLNDYSPVAQYRFLSDNALDFYLYRFRYNDKFVFPEKQQPFYTDEDFNRYEDASQFECFKNCRHTLYLMEQLFKLLNKYVEERRQDEKEVIERITLFKSDTKYSTFSNLLLTND